VGSLASPASVAVVTLVDFRAIASPFLDTIGSARDHTATQSMQTVA